MTDRTCHKARIERLRADRRKNLREARRARARRVLALAAVRAQDTIGAARLSREKAQSALRAYRRNRDAAQENLEDIRALRADCQQHSRFVRWVRHNRKVRGAQGQTWFDGHPCATWIVENYLKPARKAGARFTVTSGVRSLEKAQYLWQNAGRLGLVHYRSVAYPCSSNHCGYIFPKGATDNWPPYELRNWVRNHQVPGRELRFYMDTVGAGDAVHASHTGH